ncbi:MAG: beta-ketoacyl-[acyl-carrier-protein] synthase family protein [Pirellulaceae bacterium]|nr:beta-ketoacyl-[acyl-carrier-protein] synthase family protein [Pirellulaceae bacterium]
MLDREVVITGVGVVSPIGIGRTAFLDSIRAGRSGVAPIEALAETRLPVKFGAELSGFDPKLYVKPRKSLKVMCREIQIGYAAGTLAIDDAKLVADQIDSDRFGVIYASELFYGELAEYTEIYRNCTVDGEFRFPTWGDRFQSDMFPLWMLKYLPNMVGCHVAIAHDARGPNNTIVLGEASSLLAFAECAYSIARGVADVMIAGGTGSRLNLTACLFRGDSNLSHRADAPEKASRPFDADRDGMVNGEGAGAVILESRAHAEARGATILAHMVGAGQSCEPRLDGRPASGGALQRSIMRALSDAAMSPADIGHYNAHGLATIDDDRLEAKVVQECLGNVPVTAIKSYFGNLGAGGGMCELAASVLALVHGEIPRTLNYERPDPECPIQVVREPQPVDRPTAMIANQSGTGQAAAVILRSD